MQTVTRHRRTGRKPKPFIASDGEHVNGLRRRAHDGRWILADGRTFTEPDEQRALKKFREMTGTERPGHLIVRSFAAQLVETRRHRIEWLIDELTNRPQLLAKDSGIEQLGYLRKIVKPEPLPPVESLAETWTAHARCSKPQVSKVLRAWEDFVEWSGIESLDDISKKTVVDFQDDVHDRQLSPKQQSHIFTGIRRIVRFSKGRTTIDSVSDHYSKLLGHMADMKPNGTIHTVDPRPIEVEDFHALLNVARGDDRAMLLLMLNCALYIREVTDLRWTDFKKGCLIANRKKTGECLRVAEIWPETQGAMDAMERKTDHLFLNYLGKPIHRSGAFRRFAELAVKAGLSKTGTDKDGNEKVVYLVTPSQLRDGAATKAAEANTNEQLINLLLGHASGMKDKYVLRNPKMVKPATDSVYAAYFTSACG